MKHSLSSNFQQFVLTCNFLVLQVANMRHNALFRRFISALTRGGPGGLPRPIEVHAHDPLRYVGDMLGWLHQVVHCGGSIVSPLQSQSLYIDCHNFLSLFYVISNYPCFRLLDRLWHLKRNLLLHCSILMQWQMLEEMLTKPLKSGRVM